LAPLDAARSWAELLESIGTGSVPLAVIRDRVLQKPIPFEKIHWAWLS
jgi:hypothetical protein